MLDKRYQGTCKWFSKDKGFGFILLFGESQEFFVHHSCISTEVMGRRTLNENDKVEFSVKEGPRGSQAVDVIIINE